VHVPVDLAYFEGHFEGHAILPGVVQVEVLVARQVATTWPELGAIRKLTRLRFRRPIRPGDDLVLELTRPERERVDFDVRRGTEPCTSGTLHFEV
jgi:3-hydroxymyristoyl/3-hydroxydecanoyl-(acyl carrier protein) dehydratase